MTVVNLTIVTTVEAIDEVRDRIANARALKREGYDAHWQRTWEPPAEV